VVNVVKWPLLVLTADQSACCQLQANCWGEKMVFDQIQCYFSVNKLTTDFQHNYREGHSTCTGLTQMTDDWLKEIDNMKIVRAVLLYFSAAFDIIDHNLLRKRMAYGFSTSAISFIQSYLSN
jgi:hypothetical protein